MIYMRECKACLHLLLLNKFLPQPSLSVELSSSAAAGPCAACLRRSRACSALLSWIHCLAQSQLARCSGLFSSSTAGLRRNWQPPQYPGPEPGAGPRLRFCLCCCCCCCCGSGSRSSGCCQLVAAVVGAAAAAAAAAAPAAEEGGGGSRGQLPGAPLRKAACRGGQMFRV